MAKDGLQLRQGLPAMLALLAALCVGCLALCLAVMDSAKDSQMKLTIGVVDKDKTMVSQMAMGMVKSNEQVAALFEVVDFEDPQDAIDAVVEGHTVAALIFEEGYIDKIQYGEDSAVQVVLSRKMKPHAQMIREFAGTGEVLIKTGQYGAEAAWQPIIDGNDNRQIGAFRFDVFTAEYAVELLALTGTSVDGAVLDYSARAGSVEAHYILYYIVLLMALMDMLFFDFVRRESNRTLLCRLKSAGVGGEHILAAKLPFLLLTKTALLAVVLVILGLIFGLKLTAFTIFSAVCFLIFISVCGVGLCALFQGSDVGPCILCAIAFAGLFLSGGLVPYDMMPETVTRWGVATPVGAGATLLSPMFGGTVSVWHYVICFFMAAACLVAGWWSMERLRVKGSERV